MPDDPKAPDPLNRTIALNASDVEEVPKTSKPKGPPPAPAGALKTVVGEPSEPSDEMARIRAQFMNQFVPKKPAAAPAAPSAGSTTAQKSTVGSSETQATLVSPETSDEIARIKAQFMGQFTPKKAAPAEPSAETNTTTIVALPPPPTVAEPEAAPVVPPQEPSRSAENDTPLAAVVSSFSRRRRRMAEPAADESQKSNDAPAAPPKPPDPWVTISTHARQDNIAARTMNTPAGSEDAARSPADKPVPEDPVAVFQSRAFGPAEWFVRELSGREALGDLYEYTLEIEALFREGFEGSQSDLLLTAPAYVAFGAQEFRRTHGIVRDVELVSVREDKTAVYRITLVPRLWLLSQTIRSRVFQDLSVPDIVRAVLRGAGMAGNEFAEFHVDREYPRREYVAQYQESDLQFLCRILEHEGIFFYFAQAADNERVVFCDSVPALPESEPSATLTYQPDAGRSSTHETVSFLARRRSRVAREVALQDYNWRTPSISLATSANVDPEGLGMRVLYGEHYKTPEEGQRLAQVRANEILAQREVYRGKSRAMSVMAGRRFKLEGHFDSGCDREYLVLEVTQRVSQRFDTEPSDPGRIEGYVNDFVAIPASAAFAPVRATPRPRIYGVLHGRVDGADIGAVAPIDDQGRYRVVLPFAMAEKPGQNVSRWVRMAQVASGNGYGMHFPIHVGTEVLLTHIDGDPDRPIIVGSVPNAETRSPVTQENATQSVFRTRGQIRLVFSDD